MLRIKEERMTLKSVIFETETYLDRVLVEQSGHYAESGIVIGSRIVLGFVDTDELLRRSKNRLARKIGCRFKLKKEI